MKKGSELKNKILNLLLEGDKSTSEIAMSLSRNYYDILKALEELELEKQIKNFSFKNYNFWRLNGKSD